MPSLTTIDLLARGRHDIGKYLTCAARFLEQRTEAELREALRLDLGATRSNPSGSVGDLWAELRPAWLGEGLDTARIDDDVAALMAGLHRLDSADLAGLEAIAARAAALADHLRALHRAAVSA